MLVEARLIAHLPLPIECRVGLQEIKIQCCTTIYPGSFDGSKDDQHLNAERIMNIFIGNPGFMTILFATGNHMNGLKITFGIIH